jgi:hypothetical protein
MGKKILSAVFMLLVCSSLLLSQSLVDVAKKEKERRAKLKGKSGKVVTNDDLKKVKKPPKVVTNEDLKKSERQPSVSTPALQASAEDTSEKTVNPDKKPDQPKSDSTEQAKSDETKRLESLLLKYEKAKEQVEKLTTKMNGLFMKYYSPDDTTPREMIQSEISRTGLQLQKARDDEEKAKKELEDYKSKNRNKSFVNGSR